METRKLGEGSLGQMPVARGATSSSLPRAEEGAAASVSHRHPNSDDAGAEQDADADDEAEPFVNRRLAAWLTRRADWLAAGAAGNGGGGGDGGDVGDDAAHKSRTHRRPVLSADATYDDLLTSSRPFSKPVPLTEMVDFLVEVWDEEGLYD
mmetsp:Transcript_16629/g.26792  ORF Transcript_16629/g.26792 Transcript_16629/m.26792 type:complete len:151 (+) Transcript_16629:174-626(+)